ncbi:hypothetical protein PHLCEN_2v10187 [Hermanssonia centrifuga]|uniref:Uncharacterized protein n=1 Tax=Hermanssonia centrifuga TaxID=98765 RepID=A0A2R6NNM1_9APHY|nr:hypothetical protein PHLCEN_2v10187 [Hermanssonia centrifuga]
MQIQPIKMNRTAQCFLIIGVAEPWTIRGERNTQEFEAGKVRKVEEQASQHVRGDQLPVKPKLMST